MGAGVTVRHIYYDAKPGHIPGEVSVVIEHADGDEWIVTVKHADPDAVPCAWLERQEGASGLPWSTSDLEEAQAYGYQLWHGLRETTDLTRGLIYAHGLCIAPHPCAPCGQHGRHTDDPGTHATKPKGYGYWAYRARNY